jgi:hypothetical protein
LPQLPLVLAGGAAAEQPAVAAPHAPPSEAVQHEVQAVVAVQRGLLPAEAEAWPASAVQAAVRVWLPAQLEAARAAWFLSAALVENPKELPSRSRLASLLPGPLAQARQAWADWPG